MASRLGYRLASTTGVATGSVLAVVAANHPVGQRLATLVPVLDRLPATTLSPEALWPMAATTAVVVVLACLPQFRPRPRRVLDTVRETARRVLLAGVALAALGYFDYTYRLPRTTLIVATGFMVVTLPAWLTYLGRRPPSNEGRAVLVGDDPQELAAVAAATDLSIVGYAAPPGCAPSNRESTAPVAAVDGGTVAVSAGETANQQRTDELGIPRLGGLARLEQVLLEHDVDVAALAFSEPDRAEFFGTLEICHEHGVATMVHREHADSVLVGDGGRDTGPLVDVDLEPWDWQDHLLKRAFDLAFALAGLVLFAPVMLVIAAAIVLEDDGPVLYRQERTASFGERFRVAKFRTMVPESEDAWPSDDEDDRNVTGVGRILRRTHLDELPQLWTILLGRMSVVGPRAAWTEEESYLEESADAWRKRWFVKPGLTGLAQVNGATSTDPRAKLRYDIEYIRRQSFRFDLAIVGRQVWQLCREIAAIALSRVGRGRYRRG